MITMVSAAKRINACISGLSLTFFFLECFLYSGIVFGWASLVYVFKSAQYFYADCEAVREHDEKNLGLGENNDGNYSYRSRPIVWDPQDHNASQDYLRYESCSVQDQRLNLVYTVTQTVGPLLSLIPGALTDYCSPTSARVLCWISLNLGFLLVAYSTPGTSFLLFPATLIVDIAGFFVFSINLKISDGLFPPWRGTITAGMCGAYDSSAAMGLFVDVAYQNGLTVKNIFLIFFASTAIYFINTVLFRKVNKDQAGLEKPPAEEEASFLPTPTDNKFAKIMRDEFPTLRSCLTSTLYLSLVAYLSILSLQNKYFIGAFNSRITDLTDFNEEQVSYYTRIFNSTQLVGIIVAPVMGIVLDRNTDECDDYEDPRHLIKTMKNNQVAFTITSFVFVVFCVIELIPDARVQYVSFLAICVGRAFLYSAAASFLKRAFPHQFLGRLYGIMISISAAINLIQYPLFVIATKTLSGQHFYVNLFLFVCVLLTFLHSIIVHNNIKQKQRFLILHDFGEGQE